MSIHQQIADKIAHMKSGMVLFPSDFRGAGSDTAIKMSLSRFVGSGKLLRLSHGIYLKPGTKKNSQEMPTAEELAEAIAKKEAVKIRPSGKFAQFKLGIVQEMPEQLIYITDGEPRKIIVAEKTVIFKSTTPKKLSMSGPISSLAVLVLEEVGQKNLDDKLIEKLESLVKKEDRQLLLADIKKAPAWIYNLLRKILNGENENTDK